MSLSKHKPVSRQICQFAFFQQNVTKNMVCKIYQVTPKKTKEQRFSTKIDLCLSRTITAKVFIACTKPYYLDVADDSRVCYVEKDFLSKVICKKLHDEVQWLRLDQLVLVIWHLLTRDSFLIAFPLYFLS